MAGNLQKNRGGRTPQFSGAGILIAKLWIAA
jgi:hypothetical protein